jgi:arylsulfatase A-like enzyme
MALVALLVAHAGCTSTPVIPAGDPLRPDVILVSIDTLRADHLSCYGHDRPTSPFMDGLAANGVRFDHARSTSPWTLPAHTTMLSGQLPSTHQVSDDHLVLDDSVSVLPEVMAAAGYRTGGSVATLYVGRKFGFDRGFSFFDDHDIKTERANLRGDVNAPDVIESAVDWIEDLPVGEPLFLFLHFYDVHYHYDPPAPYDTMFDRAPKKSDRRFRNYYSHKKKPLTEAQLAHQLAQYDEAIRYMDDQLAALHKLMGDAGRKQRWVITSDHGEEFGERGSWGHAHSLYAEQLRVPLILSGAGIPSGVVVKEAVGIHDIAPTIAGWVGATMSQADGINLAPAMAGAPVPSRMFPAETTRFKTRRVSLYQDGNRIEWNLRNNKTELFASDSDRLETSDLSGSRKDIVQQMRTQAEKLFGRPWTANVPGTVTVEKGRLLRAGAKRKLGVVAGDTFQVFPYDAELRLQDAAGVEQGPWRSTVAVPAGSALSYASEVRTAGVSLDAETRKRLEALGYVQGEE